MFSQVSLSQIHPLIHQLLGTYYIPSPVPNFGDRNIKKTGSLQPQTHNPAEEADKLLTMRTGMMGVMTQVCATYYGRRELSLGGGGED